MKTIIIAVCFFTFALNILKSQWVVQPTGTTQHLQKILNFSSIPVSIATGTGGVILKTTNSGTNWLIITSPVSTSLTDICSAGPTLAFISANGSILKSTNSGTNWSTTGTVPNRFFSSVFFLNSNTGWACGQTDTIIKTTNGGVNWILLENNLFTAENNSGIQFVNSLQGYMVGNSGTTGYILRTINGGTTWAITHTAPNAVQCIQMIDGTTGFAGTLGGVLKTTNSGSNWSAVNFNSAAISDLHFPVNAQTGFAVSTGGKIYKTTNEGNNWIELNTPPSGILRGIKFAFNSNTTGFAVGNSGLILKTTNGGGSFVGISSIGGEIPSAYKLEQNYPNPFNPSTSIRFSIPQAGSVRIAVYDLLGSERELLLNEYTAAGNYDIKWNAAEFPSGIYFVKMTAAEYNETKRMVLAK
jgi:photosystem II stability/assembly factor-like uncharacterized protein